MRPAAILPTVRFGREPLVRHRALLATIGLLLSAGPALADAIDGHWCGPDGRRLQIDGPAIVTPGGGHLQGTYDRHHFSYTIPAPEAGAGQTVALVLLGETAVRVAFGDAAPQIWNRCAPPLSLRFGPRQETRTRNG